MTCDLSIVACFLLCNVRLVLCRVQVEGIVGLPDSTIKSGVYREEKLERKVQMRSLLSPAVQGLGFRV